MSGVVKVPMRDHSFFNRFGGMLDLDLSETEDRVVGRVPSVLSYFTGDGEQRFVVVSGIFGI